MAYTENIEPRCSLVTRSFNQCAERSNVASPPHKTRNNDTPNGETNRPARTDPAKLERAKPFDLTAHRDHNSLQTTTKHEKNHAA
jgi:hypothetical protein